MGWETRFQNNDPSYLEPRISNAESSLAQIVAQVISIKNPPSPLVGAKGDGVTDDTTAIQNILDYVYNAGGGEVLVPEGHFITTKALRVKDNVTLKGIGYKSWIENKTVSGAERCVVYTGNIGNITSSTSIYNETQYALNNFTFGTNQVTFTTSTDANHFNVGDIVFILSNEKWSATFPDSMVAKYQNMNKIVSNSGGVLTLKYTIPDSYTTPTICKISGTLLGIDNNGGWMAQNAKVTNLRLTHGLGQTSGWYVIFSCGFECEFTNLYLDSSSTMFGTNALGYSRIENVIGNFDAGACDMADMQINNLYKNIKATRIGNNTNVNRLGFSCHDGADNTIENCDFDFGNLGNISGLYQHRFRVIKTKLFNSSSESVKACIYGCIGDGFYCEGNIIKNGNYHGIYIGGNKAKVLNNILKSINYTTGYYGILLDTNAKDSIVENNTIGENGNTVPQDTIYQSPSFDASNIIKNNTFYAKQDNYAYKTNTQTSSLTDYVLASYTIKKTTYRKSAVYKIVATGAKSGVNGTKTVKLKLGGNIIAEVDWAATDSQSWYIEATIAHGDFDTTPRCYGRGMKDLAITYQNVQQLTSLLTNDTTLTLEASVANASDVVTMNLFVVNVLD